MRRAEAHSLMVVGCGLGPAILTFSQNWWGTFDTRAEFDFFESSKRKTFWRTVTIWRGFRVRCVGSTAAGRAHSGVELRRTEPNGSVQ